MKTFLHFLRLEIALFLRGRVALFWTFAFPVFMLVIQMALFGGGSSAGAVKIGLADLDHSEASQRYAQFVTRAFSGQLALHGVVTPLAAEPTTADPYHVVIVLPAGFGSDADRTTAGVVRVLRPSGQPIANTVYGLLQGVTSEYNLWVAHVIRSAVIESSWVGPKTRQVPYSLFLVTGLSFMVILSTSLMGFANPLVGSRESGVYRIYHLYPIQPVVALAAFWLARLLIVASSIALLFAVAGIFYKVPISTSGLPLALGFIGLFLGTAGFLSFGLVIAAFARDTATATMVCNLCYTLLLFSGNLLLPTGGLPSRWQAVAAWLPLNAMAETVRRCLSGQPDVPRELLTCGLMVGATVVCLAMAQRWFRWLPHKAG